MKKENVKRIKDYLQEELNYAHERHYPDEACGDYFDGKANLAEDLIAMIKYIEKEECDEECSMVQKAIDELQKGGLR